MCKSKSASYRSAILYKSIGKELSFATDTIFEVLLKILTGKALRKEDKIIFVNIVVLAVAVAVVVAVAVAIAVAVAVAVVCAGDVVVALVGNGSGVAALLLLVV